MNKYGFLEARIKMLFRNQKYLSKAFHQAAKMFLNYALANNLTYCRISLNNCHSTYLTIAVKKETSDIYYGLYYNNTREVSKSAPIDLLESELKYLRDNFQIIYENIMSSLSSGKFSLKLS